MVLRRVGQRQRGRAGSSTLPVTPPRLCALRQLHRGLWVHRKRYSRATATNGKRRSKRHHRSPGLAGQRGGSWRGIGPIGLFGASDCVVAIRGAASGSLGITGSAAASAIVSGIAERLLWRRRLARLDQGCGFRRLRNCRCQRWRMRDPTNDASGSSIDGGSAAGRSRLPALLADRSSSLDVRIVRPGADPAGIDLA